MSKKAGAILLAGAAIGGLVLYERSRVTVDARKLLTVDQLKAQVQTAQATADNPVDKFLSSSFVQHAPISGRTQFIFTSPQEENAMGLASYKQIVASSKICNDPAVTQILQRVGWRIAAVVPPQGFNWVFTLLNSNTVNAFCLPGGEVCVYTAILPFCQNEAGLATVLGHEISHAIARHGGERMTETGIIQKVQTGFDSVLKAVKLPASLESAAMTAFGSAANVGVNWPFSRMQESEADDMGLDYMAAAGYDPREAIAFWTRFSKATGAKKPAWLSDHPSDESRIDDIKSRVETAMQYYDKSPQYGAGDVLPGVKCA